MCQDLAALPYGVSRGAYPVYDDGMTDQTRWVRLSVTIAGDSMIVDFHIHYTPERVVRPHLDDGSRPRCNHQRRFCSASCRSRSRSFSRLRRRFRNRRLCNSSPRLCRSRSSSRNLLRSNRRLPSLKLRRRVKAIWWHQVPKTFRLTCCAAPRCHIRKWRAYSASKGPFSSTR